MPTGAMKENQYDFTNRSIESTLFQGDDYGHEGYAEEKILIWNKLDINSFQPSAREGHTAVSSSNSMFLFGGFETSKVTLHVYAHKHDFSPYHINSNF